MDAESLVLDRVRPVLADQADPREVVVLHLGPGRRRSSLYFLGLAGARSECRWVVKQPHSTSSQADLASPREAVVQYDALQRLHAHLAHSADAVGTPRPVAYLPELAAYVMEFVPGPTVTDLITHRAVARPGPLLEAVAGAARVLHAVHAVEPGLPGLVDVAELDVQAATRGRQALAAQGLRVRERWFTPTPSARPTAGRKVLLHGDFAPENVVLSPSGLCCLEPDLCERDWAEHDVVRFLVMLFDAPLFVVGGHLPPVRSLRRRAATTFLDAYYGSGVRPAALRPLMIASLALRWSTRRSDLLARDSRLRAARIRLVRSHFTRLLDEVSRPTWPSLLP
jgi:hypothetical protein